jgi:hypothetical protein
VLDDGEIDEMKDVEEAYQSLEVRICQLLTCFLFDLTGNNVILCLLFELNSLMEATRIRTMVILEMMMMTMMMAKKTKVKLRKGIF